MRKLLLVCFQLNHRGLLDSCNVPAPPSFQRCFQPRTQEEILDNNGQHERGSFLAFAKNSELTDTRFSSALIEAYEGRFLRKFLSSL